jgi:hypothetical protein
MGKRSSSYKEYLINKLKDPKERAGYINAALEDGDPDILLACLNDCAKAMGGKTWPMKLICPVKPSLRLFRRTGIPNIEILHAYWPLWVCVLKLRLTAFGRRSGLKVGIEKA